MFCVVIVVLGPGFMLLGALATHPILGNPVNGSYHGAAAAVEFVFLFGGLFVGLFLACKFIGLITRHFVDRPTYERWQAKFMESLAGMPSPLRFLEPISKLPEQQNHGRNLHKPEEILRIQLPAIQ